MKKRGTCYCHCGGVVMRSNDTIIVSDDTKWVSCRRCYQVWDADYVYSVQPKQGYVELSEDEQYNYQRKAKRGS